MDSPEEFFAAYDESGDLCMTLQGGGEIPGVFPLLRDRPGEGPRDALRSRPAAPSALRARAIRRPSPALGERMVGDALTLCRALGYDLNTVEFAVEDGVPYAIDFMNPAPDAGLESVGPENFQLDRGRGGGNGGRARAGSRPRRRPYRWSQFLGLAAAIRLPRPSAAGRSAS